MESLLRGYGLIQGGESLTFRAAPIVAASGSPARMSLSGLFRARNLAFRGCIFGAKRASVRQCMNRKQRRAGKKTGKRTPPREQSESARDREISDEPQAERLYRQILREDSRDPAAPHALGVVAHRVGRDDIAADLFARAVNLNDRMPELHFSLAIALKALGKLEDAAACYERTLALNPSSAGGAQ